MQYLSFVALLLSFLTASCSKTDARTLAARAEAARAGARLSGGAFSSAPISGATVEAYGMDGRGEKTAQLAQTTADSNGLWTMNVGSYEGAVELTAKGVSDAYPYRAYLGLVQLGQEQKNITVTPLTTLGAAYADFLAGEKESMSKAIHRAHAELQEHFASLNIFDEAPQVWPQRKAADSALSLTGPVKTTLILRALAQYADQLSEQAKVSPNTVITLSTLVHALSEDIAADGYFDGRGDKGATLTQEEIPLSSATLRAGLARAILAEKTLETEKTKLDKRATCSFARSLMESRSKLFRMPQLPEPLRCNSATAVIQGVVSVFEPVADAEVTFHEVSELGHILRVLGTARSDSNGAWSFKLDDNEMSLLIVAKVGENGDSTLKRYIAKTEGDPYPDTIQIHPLTHLQSGYTQYLLSQNSLIKDAATQTKRWLSFALPEDSSSELSPQPVRYESRFGPGKFFSPSEKLSIIFETLASMASGPDETQASFSAQEHLLSMVSLLHNDVLADGVFDGRGENGAELSLPNFVLRTETLRERLAFETQRLVDRHVQTMIENGQYAFSGESEYSTSSSYRDLQTWLAIVSNAQSPCLVGPPQGINHEPPIFVSCTTFNAGNTLKDLTVPQHGTVQVTCRWIDSDGIDYLSVETLSDSAITNRSVSRTEGTISFLWDTTKSCPEHQGLCEVSIVLQAKDPYGNFSTQTVSTRSRNTKPSVICNNCAFDQNSRKSVYWSKNRKDSIMHLTTFGAVVSLELVGSSDDIKLSKSHKSPGRQPESDDYDFVVSNRACPSSGLISLKITDEAGNIRLTDLGTGCAPVGPTINSIDRPWTDDLGKNHEHGTTGTSFYNNGVAIPVYNSFCETFDYHETFDSDSRRNLPYLTFQAQAVGSLFRGIKEMRYRVSPNSYRDTPDRIKTYTTEWRLMKSRDNFQYLLPLSYQTMVPSQFLSPGLPVNDARRTTAELFAHPDNPTPHFLIEIEAEDHSGNVTKTTRTVAIHLIGPDLVVSGIALSDQLQNYDFTDIVNLQIMGSSAFSATVNWPRLNCGINYETTLCPNLTTEFHLTADAIETRAANRRWGQATHSDLNQVYIDSNAIWAFYDTVTLVYDQTSVANCLEQFSRTRNTHDIKQGILNMENGTCHPVRQAEMLTDDIFDPTTVDGNPATTLLHRAKPTSHVFRLGPGEQVHVSVPLPTTRFPKEWPTKKVVGVKKFPILKTLRSIFFNGKNSKRKLVEEFTTALETNITNIRVETVSDGLGERVGNPRQIIYEGPTELYKLWDH